MIKSIFNVPTLGTISTSALVCTALVLKIQFLIEIYSFVQSVTTILLVSISTYVFYSVLFQHQNTLKDLVRNIKQRGNKVSNLISRASVIGIGVVAFSTNHPQISLLSAINLTITCILLKGLYALRF